MARDAFLSLPDWRERCQRVCDLHGYGKFDRLDGTRRAEVIGIATNVAGDVLSREDVSHRSSHADDAGARRATAPEDS